MSDNGFYTLVWRNSEFTLVDKSGNIPDEAVMTIDEEKRSILVTIPEKMSLVQRRTIERQVQSIAKSGFLIPKDNIRVGLGFTVEIIKSEESVPDVLLQEGHRYSYDTEIPTTSQLLTEKDSVKEKPAKVDVTGAPTFVEIEEKGKEKEKEKMKTIKYDPKIILGKFLAGILQNSELFVSKQEEMYILEFSSGRVDFTIEAGKIKILSTRRVSDNDPILEEALNYVNREL